MTIPARPFGALLCAMVTPMHEDGELDLDAAANLARYLIDHGHDGLVLSGTTGEAPTTHAPEKVELIRAVREAVGPAVPILSGAGSNDTAHAVRMAEQAAEAGADGILALVPYYSRPQQRGIVAHLTAIHDACALPIMLYDIPVRTGIALTDDSYDALAELDRVIANKDATGDVAAAKDRIVRTGLAWYSGDDPLTLDFLRQGASGVVSVSSHIAGRLVAAMIAAFDAGDIATAERIDHELAAVHEAIFDGPGAVNSKSAMHLAGVIPSRAMRLPLVPATDAEYETLRSRLIAAGVL
jgi:4-hydroxy-tetrahydrodipicolinate synthase